MEFFRKEMCVGDSLHCFPLFTQIRIISFSAVHKYL